jgi:serine/threonine protein kinase
VTLEDPTASATTSEGAPSTLAPRPLGKTERLPRIGEVVSGKYRMTKFLGMGGMGKVMAAEHVVLRHAVAIKFLHPHLATSRMAQRRFAREARTTALLRSPHAVRILDVDQLPWGAPYLVMERLEGHSLEKPIFEKQPPSATDAVKWTIQACHALAEAHARGIVHRDIKPENLFLARMPSGEAAIKLLDLGLAKWLEEDGLASTGETATNAAVGSPQYMAPEQIRGEPVDHRVDLWALGATLYELLTCRPPFVASNVQDLFRHILHAPVRSLGELRPDLPRALVAVVMRCLERDPARRWASASELAAALDAAMPRAPVPPDRVSARVPAERVSAPSFAHVVSVARPASTGARGALFAVLAVATVVLAAVSTFALGVAARNALRGTATLPAAAATLPSPAAHAKRPADF